VLGESSLSEPEARAKIKEAKHFLGQMRGAQDKLDEDLFKYNLSAFLAAWRSVPEFVLYDYAERNSLGISREDEEKVHIAIQFRIVANAIKRLKDNVEPLAFMEWWNERCNAIYKEHGIVGKRNYTIHKGYPKVEKVAEVERIAFVPTGSFNWSTGPSGSTITVSDYSGSATYTATGPSGPAEYSSTGPSGSTITVSDYSGSATYTATGPSGSAITASGPSSVTLAPMGSAAPANVTETFRFHDRPDKDIVDICADALADMDAFVGMAETEEWKKS
jgi:hypothetical protein